MFTVNVYQIMSYITTNWSSFKQKQMPTLLGWRVTLNLTTSWPKLARDSLSAVFSHQHKNSKWKTRACLWCFNNSESWRRKACARWSLVPSRPSTLHRDSSFSSNCLRPGWWGSRGSFAKLCKPVGKWGQRHTSSTGYLFNRIKLSKLNLVVAAKTGSESQNVYLFQRLFPQMH